MDANEINKFMSHFKPIYNNGKEINPIPKDVKLTVWCDDGKDEQGFAYNTTVRDMGINALIAKAWIKQDELEYLYKNSKDEVVDTLSLETAYNQCHDCLSSWHYRGKQDKGWCYSHKEYVSKCEDRRTE